MIEKTHFKDGISSEAIFSECGLYRYKLARKWGDGPMMAYILLLPAEGTEVIPDMVEGRCYRRAYAMGFGGVAILNLFGYRMDYRSELFDLTAPVGVDNDRVIMDTCKSAQQVICAWGLWGRHLGRDRIVGTMLAAEGIDTYHLGLSRSGVPRHVLNVRDSVQPKLWKKA